MDTEGRVEVEANEAEPVRPTSTGRLLVWVRRLLPILLAVGAFVAFLALKRASVERTTLEVMGFDPDRADLIVAMTLTAMCAVLATLPGTRRAIATTVGFAAGVAYFGPIFVRETQVALGPIPPNGPFDPLGWTLTLAALLSSGLAVSWSCTVVCAELLRSLGEVAAVVAGVLRRKKNGNPGNPIPPAATLVVALIFVGTSPTLVDLLTGMPDVHMSTGGAPGVYFEPGPEAQQVVAVVNETAPPSAVPTASPSEEPTATPSETPSASPSPTQSASPSPRPTATASRRPSPTPAASQGGLRFPAGPWLAWRPSGGGRLVHITEPPPWNGGFQSNGYVTLYLPAGYDKSTRHYPVFYQAPWGIAVWQDNYHLTAVLDDLISSGRIPASIFVFASDWGGPFGVSECADSADGQEWFDSYMVNTVVPAIDQGYRTIPERAARVLWGFSDGAHCAATLGLHHPDVFGQAVLVSGFYNTDSDHLVPPERLPFGEDKALMLAYSPLALVSTPQAHERHDLFFVVAGDPADTSFGPDMTALVNAINKTGFPCVMLRVNVIHGWDQVRRVLPTTFQEAAARMTQDGVFRSS